MFLANENIPFPSIEFLRSKGIEITSIAEQFQGISDDEVLEIASEKKLIILTQDSDYGTLIFRYSKQFDIGLVFVRNTFETPEGLGRLIMEIIESKVELKGMFTTIDHLNIRQRKL